MSGIRVRGLEEVQRFVKDLPYGAKKIVLPAIADYLVGDGTHGLTWYPPKQGQKYNRTYELKNAWGIKGGLYNERIVNTAPYAQHVPNMWGIGGYINYGWRQWMKNIEDNMQGALRHANAELNKWLSSR